MLVHPVVIPGSGIRSWTVLGDDDVLVVPVDRFLAYLTGIGRSPNTVKAYSHDLKDYWEFLGFRRLDWREARLEDVGEFVAWLQLPPAGRSGEVAVLPSATAHAGAAWQDARRFVQHQLHDVCPWPSGRLRLLGRGRCHRMELRRCAAVLPQERGARAGG